MILWMRVAHATVAYDGTPNSSTQTVSSGSVKSISVSVTRDAHARDGALLTCATASTGVMWITPSGWKLAPIANNPQTATAPSAAMYEKILVSGDIGATVTCSYKGTAARMTARTDQWSGTPSSGEITDVGFNHTQRNGGGTTNACQDDPGGIPNYASDMMAFVCINIGGPATYSAASNRNSFALSQVSTLNNSALAEVQLTGWTYPHSIGTNEAAVNSKQATEGFTIGLLSATRTQVVALDMVPVRGITDTHGTITRSVKVGITSTANAGDAGLIGCWAGVANPVWTTPPAVSGDSGSWTVVPNSSQTAVSPSSIFYEKVLETNDLGSTNQCAFTGAAAASMTALFRAYSGTPSDGELTDVNTVYRGSSLSRTCTDINGGITPNDATDLMTFFCGQTANAALTYASFSNAESFPLLQIPPSGALEGLGNAQGLLNGWTGGAVGENSVTLGTAEFNSGTTITLRKATSFRHIVVIFQENRTPDNLFQGLCSPPYGSVDSCSTSPGARQYDVQTSNWLNKESPTRVTQPGTVPLANDYDLDHSHYGFVAMCDADAGGACRMDGAAGIGCKSGTCPAPATFPPFNYVDNSTGIMNPYLELATHYGWANYMFQTNQGSSFPAHQYIFGGTSAPTAADDAAGIFVQETDYNEGCISSAGSLVNLITPMGIVSPGIYPCFEHQTVPDLLASTLTWRYYEPPGAPIWDAPLAISHICESSGLGGECTGSLYANNVDPNPTDVLTDIAKCHLRSLSWIIPTGANSDHANGNDGGGPSWVASIVNAIGKSTSCDGGAGYWKDTAVIITWDDWGGWYDHEPPTILSSVQGDYERGFRVPLIVVSAYTPAGYINNKRLDFGSILRFIEENFGLEPGALNFADARTAQDLSGFFNIPVNQNELEMSPEALARSAAVSTRTTPRKFVKIKAPKDAYFFIRDKRPPTPPDDD
jgi:phospholipase C